MSVPDAGPRENGHAADLQIFRRTFDCGHLDEFIEVRLLEGGEKLHNINTLEVFKEYNRAENCPVNIKARCLNCARKAKDEDDRDQRVRPKKTLGAYQAGTSSTYARKTGIIPQGGFEGILERYRCSNSQGTAVKPHPRVSEEAYRAHRLEVKAEAAAFPGKWLAIPARRVESAIHRRMSRLFEENNEPLQSNINGDNGSAQSGVLPQTRKDGESSGLCSELEMVEGKDTGDVTMIKAEIDPAKGTNCFFLALPSKSEDERFRPVAMNRQRKLLDAADFIGKNSDGTPSSRAMELHCPQTANSSASSARESAVMEDLVDQYALHLENDFDPALVDTRYEKPRPVPAVPKKGPLDCIKRRSNTSPRASRNFRRSRLDTPHSARSVEIMELGNESPDWACQTSLAIEAGRISMDSVSMQDRELISSKHIGSEA
ncbi:hypothetical protein BU25DRAFT_426120 [Macroventuria anomochaeta]|uniref:Uncharacterized protein n=1 Tax=Macroventuria anomochaeta TaxID=301207 RepID=A0ACB6RIX6_9PLEO|nr:uncharacterized protein BU25DRAFT_426120 [Macroventuria anomochaeta]KAF2621851.1 hypothetical protein BU25DRAFT_426120 [Macroventuria anomochaeta]